MTTDYSKIELHDHSRFRRVPPYLVGEAMGNVINVLGSLEESRALAVVDAVLSPLRLVTQPGPHNGSCDHGLYDYTHGWVFCSLDHEELGEDPDDADTEHEAEGRTFTWYADDRNDRAFGTTAQEVYPRADDD